MPAIQGMLVQSLGQKDSLEKEMATCSSVLAWETQWTEQPGRRQSMGSQWVGHNLATKQHHQCRVLHNLLYILLTSYLCSLFPFFLWSRHSKASLILESFLLFIYLFLFNFFFIFVVNFVIHWNETAMGLHVFPIPSPLPPPSPPDPSRSSQCTRSKRLSHASNLAWWSVSP